MSAVAPPRLGASPLASIERALQGPGLWLDVGAATIRVRSRSPFLASQLQSVYRHFPLVDSAEWADAHVTLDPVPGLRRWVHPQVQFMADGRRPFAPFPASHPLPMLEWGANMLLGQRCNHLLLLHAGVVERDDVALILPAVPGSGKSTLAAALSLSGWRLLSDEFGAFEPETSSFKAMLKPVALKNRSIDVIRNFSAAAELGPVFPKTRKGDVAHLAASSSAIDKRHHPAAPGAVVLPRWVEGSSTRLTPLDEAAVFRSLAFNAFNYQTLGAVGFQAAVTLTRRCLGWELVYSRLDEALEVLNGVWPDVLARAARP